MVSHLDSDHIAGLLQMMQKLKDFKESGDPAPWRIERFWHNAFDDLVGNDEVSVGASGSAMTPASLGELLLLGGDSLLASVGQGRSLRKLIEAFDLEGNPPSDGLLRAGSPALQIANLKLTVIAPLDEQLRALQKDWDKKIKPILEKEQKTTADLVELADYVDESVYNLSSLVILAEADDKSVLLTGDGRGDHTLEGLEAAGLLDANDPLEVDVLKVPHHGSDRNVDLDYFERIRADHYLISADGKHDNPDLGTLRMISRARPDDDFTIHLTYPLNEFNVPTVGRGLERFFAREAADGRSYEVRTRASDEVSLRIDLA